MKIKLVLYVFLLAAFCFGSVNSISANVESNSNFAPSQVTIPKWDRFVEITGSFVNLRMTPDIEGEKLTGEFFAKGEVAPLLDETEEWAKVYYAYSPTQYVWLSKSYTRDTLPLPLPEEYRFTTYQTYGDQMLTYNFDGKLTNIVYKADYPFETTKTWADEPDLYKNNERYISTNNIDIDWNTVMPRIVKTIPDECVYEYFRGVPLFGKSYNFRTDHDTTVFESRFIYDILQGDAYYQLMIIALPTHDPDQLFLIAQSQSGLDGMRTDLLKSMRYNIKTGQYSDIQEGLPGVVIDKLGLNYDIFKDKPAWQREARQSSIRHIDFSFFSGIPMVTVSGPDLSLCYPFDPFEIEGYTQKTTVYYLWDGGKFVKMVRSPYIDILQTTVQDYYNEHSDSVNDDFSDSYHYLMPSFANACKEADIVSAQTGRPWLDFDPFTFFPKGQKFQVLYIEVISASNQSSDEVMVNVYPIDAIGECESKNIKLQAMFDNNTGRYLISDFKDENGLSVLELAKNN